MRPHTPQQEQAPHPRISGNGPYGGLYVCRMTRMCVIPAASRIPGPIWPEISANDAVALRGLIVTGARRVCGCASGRRVNPAGRRDASCTGSTTCYSLLHMLLTTCCAPDVFASALLRMRCIAVVSPSGIRQSSKGAARVRVCVTPRACATVRGVASSRPKVACR